MSEVVSFERRGDLALVRMDDGKANALTMPVILGLTAALERSTKEAKPRKFGWMRPTSMPRKAKKRPHAESENAAGYPRMRKSIMPPNIIGAMYSLRIWLIAGAPDTCASSLGCP